MGKWTRCGLVLTLTLLLPGCWDRTEVNDIGFILSSAIDLEKDGSIRYSVLLPLPGQMGGATGGGGGTSGGMSYYIDSEVGRTFREAQSKLQERMPRRMFLAHRRTILVGEALAKDSIRFIFDAIPRSPESRMTTYFIVAEGKAYELLQSTPKFERFPSEAIRELAKSKVVVDMNMKDFALALSTTGADPVAVFMGVRESEKGLKNSKEIQILGYSQFKGDRMIGTLQGDEAFGLGLLKGRSVHIPVTVTMEDRHLSFRIYDSQCQIKPKIQNGKLSYEIDVETQAKVVESSGYYDFSQQDKINAAEERVEAFIKKSIESAIKKMIDNEADSAQFGNYIWRAYPNAWKQRYRPEWPGALKQAEFVINVDAILAESGLIYNNVTATETHR
ncbi:Ger(x)C family spore germination protein [Paenibacillus sp. YYML68]|uniref:Ger(x)C family spore germination protein n=1 Tax=Paenibacillus sp. YYML68 TaxID=2909250 RepID=UPI0024927928|nr:Ger(x)C family spore germination protein [Paenibacillus sp. YYML68]